MFTVRLIECTHDLACGRITYSVCLVGKDENGENVYYPQSFGWGKSKKHAIRDCVRRYRVLKTNKSRRVCKWSEYPPTVIHPRMSVGNSGEELTPATGVAMWDETLEDITFEVDVSELTEVDDKWVRSVPPPLPVTYH